MLAMGKIQTKNIDTLFNESTQHFFAIGGRAHRSHNFGAVI
jgi:hypothetical protein